MAKTCSRCNYENTDDARFCLQCGAMMEQEAQEGEDPFVGRVLQDRYRITSVLGEGGMGKVYLAEQKMGTTTRKVAIKTLHAEFSGDPQLTARFYRECETVVDLSHPNTIKFYDFGELPETKTLFIVMEFIEGESLAHVLQRGAIAATRVDKLVIQMAGSLHEAHQKGIVHRDLKPENVLLTNRGGQTDFVKVLDFGIAKRSEAETDEDSKLTKQGMVLGTPPYMSPEQFSGEALDPRSDIYSFATMTYEMLTGQLPFEAKTPWEWATKHLTAIPRPLDAHPAAAALPEPKKAAIMRALSKNRDDRQSSVMEFLQSFTGYTDPQAAWTLATSSGSMPQAQLGTAQPRAPVGTPGPMPTPPTAHTPASGAFGTPASGSYGMVSSGGQPYAMNQPYVSEQIELPKGGGIGKILAILILGLFVIGGAGAGALFWVLNTSEDEDTSTVASAAPPSTDARDTPSVGSTRVSTENMMVPHTPDPEPQEPTPDPEPTPATEMTETSMDSTTAMADEVPTMTETSMSRMTGGNGGPSSGQRARAASLLSSARSAVASNDLDRAATNLSRAIRILGRSNRDVARVRTNLAQKGEVRIGIFLQQGNCRAAQRLFRALSSVGASGQARHYFGDWCRP